jgi:tetratricopeptide (TPR) repeat protein
MDLKLKVSHLKILNLQAIGRSPVLRLLPPTFLLLMWASTGYAQTNPVEDSPNAASSIFAAQSLMAKRDFQKASNCLLQVVKTEARPAPEVFMLLASCYQNLQQTSQALEACQQGMRLYPRHEILEDFYVTLLQNYVPVQQMADQLEAAHKKYPGSFILLRALIMALLDIDFRNPLIDPLIQQLLELRPDDPQSHYLRGMWTFRNHRDSVAISEWEKALSLSKAGDRMQMDVYTLIANAESRLNRLEKARTAYEKAWQANQRLKEHNPHAAFFYVQFLSQNAQFELGQKITDQILTWAPHFGPAHLEKALYFHRQQKPEEAIVEANQALIGTDNMPDQVRAIHVLLAKIYFALKRLDDAQIHQAWVESH